jgi:hypothetical protein
MSKQAFARQHLKCDMALLSLPFLVKQNSIRRTIQPETLISCRPIACSPRKFGAIVEGIAAKRAQVGVAALEPLMETLIVEQIPAGSTLLIG